jgi:hypothetical protein
MDKRTRQRKRREYKKSLGEPDVLIDTDAFEYTDVYTETISSPEDLVRDRRTSSADVDELIEDSIGQIYKEQPQLTKSKVLKSTKCSSKMERMKSYCMCPSKNIFILCKEEFEKCRKLDSTNLVHSHHRYCENCIMVVSHYHCTNCFKLIHKGLPVHLSDGGRGTIYTYYQGKECAFYSDQKNE